jgi:hypothetical protein
LKKTVKIAIRFFIIFFLFVVVFVTTIFILGNLYKEDIKNYVIEEINKEIDVKIQVNSIDISVFRKFPYVSVVLSNATAWSGHNFDKKQFIKIETDTLFTASKIFLQFNLISILNKNYRIKRIHAVNGKVNLFIDRYGLTNYRLFKHDPKEKSIPVSVALDGVKISGFQWKLINLSKDIHSSGLIKDLVLKGKFANKDFSMNTTGFLMVENFTRENIQFADKLSTGIKINLDVHDSLYKINRGEISLNDMDFRVSGSFTSNLQTKLFLQLEADRIDITSFFTSLPLEIKSIEQFNPSGKIDLIAKISGEISRTKVPDIHAAFKINQGKFFLTKPGLLFEGIQLQGTYSNGSRQSAHSSSINLSEYSFLNGKTQLRGSFSIENFVQPQMKAMVSGLIDVQVLTKFVTIPGLQFEKGFFQPDLIINASLSGTKEFQVNNIKSLTLTGKSGLDNITCTLPGYNEHIEFLSGKIKFEGDTWYPDIVMKTGKSDVKLNIEADHVLGFFLHKKTSLWLKGDVYSHYLDLKKLVSATAHKDTLSSVLPQKLYLKFNYAADSLIYGKFRAENITANIDYKPAVLSVSGLNLKTMKGRIESNGIITDDGKSKLSVKSQSNLDKIDITNLFYTFNNFAQNFIIDKNLRGLISGDLQMNILIDYDFNPDFATLTANSDIIISDGELVNFDPIKELSGFVELSELEHIKFSTLQNSILIKERKVYIPQMDINSSAFNITISGTHDFDNYFEYKLKVNLSEILAKKARMAKKENEEFGVVEKDNQDRTSIFLSITGTPDDYKIKYDKKEAVNKIRNDLQKEKKVLKTILKDEFGLFKNDSTINTLNKKEQKEKFIMEWGVENSKSSDTTKKIIKNKKGSDFEIEWEP